MENNICHRPAARCKVSPGQGKVGGVVIGASYADWGNVKSYTQGALPVAGIHPSGAFTSGFAWPSLVKSSRHVQKVRNYALCSATTDFAEVNGFTGPNSEFPVAGALQQLAMYQENPASAVSQRRRSNLAYVLFPDVMLNDMYFDWVVGRNISSDAWLAGSAASSWLWRRRP